MYCNKLWGKKVRLPKFPKDWNSAFPKSETQTKHEDDFKSRRFLHFHILFQFFNYKLCLQSAKSLGYLFPIEPSSCLTSSYAFISVASQREDCFLCPTHTLKLHGECSQPWSMHWPPSRLSWTCWWNLPIHRTGTEGWRGSPWDLKRPLWSNENSERCFRYQSQGFIRTPNF